MKNKKAKKIITSEKDFIELQKFWYRKLDDSGFNDIERTGKHKPKFLKGSMEYAAILDKTDSSIRAQYSSESFQFYQYAREFSQSGRIASKIDAKILELYGNGKKLQEISKHLQRYYKPSENKRGRKPKNGNHFSIFFVHYRLKKLKKLLALYILEMENKIEDEPEIIQAIKNE